MRIPNEKHAEWELWDAAAPRTLVPYVLVSNILINVWSIASHACLIVKIKKGIKVDEDILFPAQ